MATLDATLKLFTDTNAKEFLKFLKGRYKLIHLSNLFFRDIHYGVMSFLELNNVKHGYTNAEALTTNVIAAYEQSGVFKKLDGKTWLLNFPEFKLPVTKPAVAAKPAAGTARPATPGAAVPRPAGAAAPKPVAAVAPVAASITPASAAPTPSTETPNAPAEGTT